ncbi:homocysteine S-methyltransferase family protein [Allosediminivita pacifica]|uniref:Homocysteine S-methyltransferase n=1 Tax=Allosediminivita pacifica TaxID=1267769 RepID=A0A2T6AD65_9RHOB|nr:homocysteine S-methyltransferase family protein [Allosediminivita pacifica]PTX41764.1 homocysteine S-methyltransferase [Allosediminivita pacifica]GGB22716.1 homocysteine S-methyltransferase [Allosediminivita pacifica]
MRTVYRNRLPQLDGAQLLTDSGLETTLLFLESIDLPCFASYPLLESASGREVLRAYFERHLAIAADHEVGFLLEAPTWRASRDWGAELGHTPADLARFNTAAIELLADIRKDSALSPVVISGNIGPRGDGYTPDLVMTAEEAEAYHAEQIGWFSETEADMVSAFTITTVNEGVGIIRAAAAAGMPCVVSYTTETDGRLPDGTPLGEAIERTDMMTAGAAAYFMVNCAHPDHFRSALEADAAWLGRVWGVRANASRLSHAELDAATDLDSGNPAELGHDYARLARMLPNLRVFGGCCGTDHRHVEAMADCCCRQPAA